MTNHHHDIRDEVRHMTEKKFRLYINEMTEIHHEIVLLKRQQGVERTVLEEILTRRYSSDEKDDILQEVRFESSESRNEVENEISHIFVAKLRFNAHKKRISFRDLIHNKILINERLCYDVRFIISQFVK